jgi:hypothetical protein
LRAFAASELEHEPARERVERVGAEPVTRGREPREQMPGGRGFEHIEDNRVGRRAGQRDDGAHGLVPF